MISKNKKRRKTDYNEKLKDGRRDTDTARCPFYPKNCRDVLATKEEVSNVKKDSRWSIGVLLLIAIAILGAIQFYNSYQTTRIDDALSDLAKTSKEILISQAELRTNQNILLRQFGLDGINSRRYGIHER